MLRSSFAPARTGVRDQALCENDNYDTGNSLTQHPKPYFLYFVVHGTHRKQTTRWQRPRSRRESASGERGEGDSLGGVQFGDIVGHHEGIEACLWSNGRSLFVVRTSLLQQPCRVASADNLTSVW